MSNFITQIPIRLELVKKLLPQGSTFDRAEWNKEKSCVDLFWFNAALQTKYSFPWPFPIENLESATIPLGVMTAEMRTKSALDEAESVRQAELDRANKADLEAKANIEKAAKFAAELKAKGEQNVLTVQTGSPKKGRVEKLAGKSGQPKGRANRSSAKPNSGNTAAPPPPME